MSIEREIDRLSQVKDRLAEKHRQELASNIEEIRKEMPGMVERAERLDAAIVNDDIEYLTMEWHLGSEFEGTEYPSRFLGAFAYPERVFKTKEAKKNNADLFNAKNKQTYIECFEEYVLPYKATRPKKDEDLTTVTIVHLSLPVNGLQTQKPEEDFMLFFDSVYGMVRDLRELNPR